LGFYARLVAALKLLFAPTPAVPQISERQELMQFLATQQAQILEVVRSTNETAAKMADASKAQAENFSSYLNLFKVNDAPAHRAMDDAAEYEEELKRQGFPVDGSQEDQLAWVLKMSE
jgi:hypothetical protein